MTLSVRESTRTSLWVVIVPYQSEPWSSATASAAPPSSIVATTLFVRGSMRLTPGTQGVSSPPAPQTAELSAASWVQALGAGIVAKMRSECGSMRTTTLGGPLTSVQSDPALERIHFGYEPVDYPTALLLTVRGRMKVDLGDPPAGLTDLMQVGRAMTELGVLNPGMIDWRLHAVRALLALGRNADAEDLARENLELARQASGPITVGAAIRVRATTLVGPERIALLDEAIRVLRPSGARLQLAQTLLAMGVALGQDGQPRAAREALTESFDLATGCHALRTAELARAELLAGGARPRRRPVNPDELTLSEASVAR